MPDKGETEALSAIISLAQQWSGCNFSSYNQGTITRRIARRMIDVRCHTMEQYLHHLISTPAEYPRLLTTLTIKVSSFFRDREVFSLLADKVLPRLFHYNRETGGGFIRCWSSACARGEEAYSLAILIAEQLIRAPGSPHITILGTDLDSDALAAASIGIYQRDSLAELPEKLLSRYFIQDPELDPDRWRIAPGLRKMVDFAPFDLTNTDRLAPPSGIFARYDLILCRNMLIYCQHDLKSAILQKLYTCLRPGGFLILGRSESLPESLEGCFQPVNQPLKVFVRKEETA